jgi:hypothetical protein
MERSIRNQFTFKEDDKYFDMSDPSLGAVYNERDYAKNLDNDSQNAYNSYQNPQQQTNNNNEVVYNKANVQVTNHFEDDIPEIEEIQDFESAMPSEVATPSNSNPTDSYAANLVNSNIEVKKNEDIIDLGPLAEQDDIFSTPRRDAEMEDDFQIFGEYKNKKEERKAFKRELKKVKRGR